MIQRMFQHDGIIASTLIWLRVCVTISSVRTLPSICRIPTHCQLAKWCKTELTHLKFPICGHNLGVYSCHCIRVVAAIDESAECVTFAQGLCFRANVVEVTVEMTDEHSEPPLKVSADLCSRLNLSGKLLDLNSSSCICLSTDPAGYSSSPSCIFSISDRRVSPRAVASA